MKKVKGTVEGVTVATYRKNCFSWTCKKSGKFYCATFHNGRQSAITYYSTDKKEINDLIREEVRKGFEKV